MKTKKVPERLCLGCKESRPKRELIRIVRSPEGVYSVDMNGKAPGRGAYICPRQECLAAAKANRGLERSFRGPIAAEVYEQLAETLAKLPQKGTEDSG